MVFNFHTKLNIGAVMRYLRHIGQFRLVLILALTFAFAVAGSAHRVPSPADASVNAFLEAGGSLDDLCGDGPFADGSSCDICRLVASFTLPDPAGMPQRADQPSGLLTLTQNQGVLATGPLYARLYLRGPPLTV